MSGNKRKNNDNYSILSFFNKKPSRHITCEETEKSAESGASTSDSEKATSSEQTVGLHIDTATAFNPNDIGHFIDKQVDLGKKEDLLKNAWVPESNFTFPPTGNRNLRFQYKWLNRWKWLLYSQTVSGAFCKYCVLFAPSGTGQQSLPTGKLVKIKYDNWKNAVEDFNKHETLKYHQTSVLDAENFISVRKGEMTSIEQSLDISIREKVTKNRLILTPIIKCVLFCGREGIALRGHRDHGRLDLDPSFDQVNEGHFRALLRLRVDAGDIVLKEHLEKSGKNSLYLSWKIQNEIISSSNLIILQKLVKSINDAKCFAVIADETTDISNVQQLSLCARFYDSSIRKMREEFLQFVPITDATGEGLAERILVSLRSFGVNTEFLVAQGYDGASAMSGKFEGVQSHIRKEIPNAIYVHCSSHCLNLVISDACEVSSIRNCMGTIEKTYVFFKTPKRQIALQKEINKLDPLPKVQRLKQLCATRWIKRHDSVRAFFDLMTPILHALQEISTTWLDREAASNAENLLCAIHKFHFMISLFVLQEIFTYSLPLSKYLQTTNIDLSEAVQYAMDVVDKIKQMRLNAEHEFCSIFNSAITKCDEFEISASMPRVIGRQTLRCNMPAESIEEYYRRSVYIPFLDTFILQLNERFVAHKNILGQFQILIPKNLQKNDDESYDEDGVLKLASMYNMEEYSVRGELAMWHKKVHSLQIRPEHALEALDICNSQIFPNIYRLLQIMATLPVTSCASERSFSTIRLLKTYLRSTTGENRLNGLAMLNIHKNISVIPDEILDELAKRPRRVDIKL